MSQTLNAAIAVVGIDIGKNSFHIVGHDERGAIVLRQKWSRGQVEARFANMRRPVNWAKHSFGLWLTAAAQRLHHNVLATALANKLARIAWTVLAQRRSYEARVEPQVA